MDTLASVSVDAGGKSGYAEIKYQTSDESIRDYAYDMRWYHNGEEADL